MIVDYGVFSYIMIYYGVLWCSMEYYASLLGRDHNMLLISSSTNFQSNGSHLARPQSPGLLNITSLSGPRSIGIMKMLL